MTRRCSSIHGTTVFVHLGVVATVVAALGLAYVGSDPVRAGVQQVISVLIGGDAAVLGDYLRSLGPWAPIVSVGLMVTQALLAPIPNVLVVFANGLAFGVGGGLAVSVLGQTVAAAVCFWVARAVGRRSAEALVGRFGLGAADRWFARWGTAGVLAARLLPGGPSDAVSFAAGLSGMRFGAFLAATAVGGVPQTLLYAYLGERAPQLVWWLLAASLALTAAVGAAAFVRRGGGRTEAVAASGS